MTKEVDVLWTGGWDSTFRLVELLTQTDATVRPHYIHDPERASADLEMSTMTKLRGLLGGRIPGATRRLLPLVVTDLKDVPPDPAIDEALARLRRDRHIGLQNAYLACYARDVARSPLELCVERTDASVEPMAGRLIRNPDVTVPDYRLEDGDDDLSTVFRWFRFPLAERDKFRMREQARDWGMAPIMKQTWFCHRPLLGRYPCGTCRPCVYVMDKRLTWRMGVPGRLRFMALERPKRLIPASAKGWLRQRAGRHIRSFLRA